MGKDPFSEILSDLSRLIPGARGGDTPDLDDEDDEEEEEEEDED